MNRKLLEHLGGKAAGVDHNVESTWQLADQTIVRGGGGEGRNKYQRPTNMRMSRWATSEGTAAMRRGSGARG